MKIPDDIIKIPYIFSIFVLWCQGISNAFSIYGKVVARAVEVEKIENRITFFAAIFTELECDRAIVEVFEKENIVQHVLRKVTSFHS